MATKKARKKTSAKRSPKKRTAGIGAKAKRSMGKVLVGAAVGAATGAVRGAVQAGGKELGIRPEDGEAISSARSRTSTQTRRSTKK